MNHGLITGMLYKAQPHRLADDGFCLTTEDGNRNLACELCRNRKTEELRAQRRVGEIE